MFLHSMKSIPLHDIVKQEYRTYQIYTLMDRAIPYLQDGLKPVQRRILFTLWKNANKGLMKVSSATGLVLTLHPHGPASIESAIVNMAQDFAFSNNYPLIGKKGYFGERMETMAAASRYIECKLGDVAKLLLFDDINQVRMIPNYDEKVMEPEALYPKLPIMLLNGAEGIGTGFSSVIPSFHHRDIVASMKAFLTKGKARKLTPYVRYYENPIEVDKQGKILFQMTFKEEQGSLYISELPKGWDASRTYKHLSKFIEEGYLKDFIDSSVDNQISIELIFKRGGQPKLAEVKKKMGVKSTLTPNYTLISERGVKIIQKVEEIIEIFSTERLKVVRRRYELLIEQFEEKIAQNSEIIRFIQQKHYEQATKEANRKSFVGYLEKQKFLFSEYLADMAIYRMTKEEVKKRQLMVQEDKKKLAEYKSIARSPAKIKAKLIEELDDVKEQLDKYLVVEEREKQKVYQRIAKKKVTKKKRA